MNSEAAMRFSNRILILAVFAPASAALVFAQHGVGGHGVGGPAFGGSGLAGSSRYGTFGSLARPSSPPLHAYTPVPANNHLAAPFGTRAYPAYSPYSTSRYSSGYGNHSGGHYNSGWHGHSGYRYRDYRHLPVSYFFAPYYYPFLSYGASPFYDESYQYGFDDQPPPSDNGEASADTAMLGDQIQQLNAQVNDLRNELQSPPPNPYEQPLPYRPQESQPQAQESAPAPPITLVLLSGRTVQVHSFAVMDNTFWDFSGQTAQKIPLSDIDVPASTKATEASGAEFPSLQAAH